MTSPLDGKGLIYQLLVTSQRQGLCTAEETVRLIFSSKALFLVAFQSKSKGLRKHMQSIGPLLEERKKENVVRFKSVSVLLLHPFLFSPFFSLLLFCWKEYPLRLVYTVNKPMF